MFFLSPIFFLADVTLRGASSRLSLMQKLSRGEIKAPGEKSPTSQPTTVAAPAAVQPGRSEPSTCVLLTNMFDPTQ